MTTTLPPNQSTCSNESWDWNKLSAIVLAGGKSSRMGRDKALLEINHVPLLQHSCQVAQAIASSVYVVTPWIDRYQAIVPSSCQFILETQWSDDGKSPGPLVGFAQGLSQIQTSWVLLLACDLPYLNVSVLQSAAQQLNSVDEAAIACLPRTNKGWEPLCGFYRSWCLTTLIPYVKGGGRSFQRWLEQEVVAELTLSNPQILFNCNTPQDLANIL
jgi:molybdenum cofactor guanylyltransferase